MYIYFFIIGTYIHAYISCKHHKSHALINERDREALPPDLDPQLNVHFDGITLLGTVIGSDSYVQAFLEGKLTSLTETLRKMDKIKSSQSKYQMLKLSINSKLRHLLRSLSSTRQPVLSFCEAHDQIIMNFFAHTFHIQNPSSELLLQASLSTSNAGMGLLSLQHMAPAAYLASLRNMLSEFAVRNSGLADIDRILSTWTFERAAQENWDKHHLLVDQMIHMGQISTWSHAAFLALPQSNTQNILQRAYSNSLFLHLLSLLDQRQSIKTLSAAGSGAAAFLHAPECIQGCALSNREFELAVKLRLGADIHHMLPDTCLCGEPLDLRGDHLLKCKRGNEWDSRHTAINQCVSAIVRSANLPVSNEILLSELTHPSPGYLPPTGRMDLVVTDSDFTTLLADVSITHPNPSANQSITRPMLQQGYFATHREHTKKAKYGQAARILGAKFIPLVLETLGSFGPSFDKFLRSLSKEFFRRSPNTDADLERHFSSRLLTLWKNRISCTLKRANDRLLLSKLSRTQQTLQRNAPRAMVDFTGAAFWSIWAEGASFHPTFCSIILLCNISLKSMNRLIHNSFWVIHLFVWSIDTLCDWLCLCMSVLHSTVTS